MPVLSATATASASTMTKRHADDHEVGGVEHRLVERVVVQQLGVVVEPDGLTDERRAHVLAGQVREAHRRRTRAPGPTVKTRNSTKNGAAKPVRGQHLPSPDRRTGPATRGSGLAAVASGGHVSPCRRCWPCSSASFSARRRSCRRRLPARCRRSSVSGDLLPRGDRRRRLGVVELGTEHLEHRVGRELSGVPGALDGRQAADELVELLLRGFAA